MWMRRCFVDRIKSGSCEAVLECLEGLDVLGRGDVEGSCCTGRTFALRKQRSLLVIRLKMNEETY